MDYAGNVVINYKSVQSTIYITKISNNKMKKKQRHTTDEKPDVFKLFL